MPIRNTDDQYPVVYIGSVRDILREQYCHLPLAVTHAVPINQNLPLCKTDSIRGVALALGRECTKGERWYILSSETVTLQTFREYGMRFDIQENFLDDKAGGFELERSMIRCAPALSRLCLVLAIATVYLTLQGTAVVAQGKRRWVDPH